LTGFMAVLWYMTYYLYNVDALLMLFWCVMPSIEQQHVTDSSIQGHKSDC